MIEYCVKGLFYVETGLTCCTSIIALKCTTTDTGNSLYKVGETSKTLLVRASYVKSPTHLIEALTRKFEHG